MARLICQHRWLSCPGGIAGALLGTPDDSILMAQNAQRTLRLWYFDRDRPVGACVAESKKDTLGLDRQSIGFFQIVQNAHQYPPEYRILTSLMPIECKSANSGDLGSGAIQGYRNNSFDVIVSK